jgi:hypothetical protein
MPWILAGGGAVVVAVVVVLIIVLTGSDTSSPDGVAQAAVDAANSKDFDKLAGLTCDANVADVKDSVDPSSAGLPKNVKVEFSLGKVEKTSDTEATAEVKIKLSGDLPEGIPAGSTETGGKMHLTSDGGDWCIKSLG